MSGLVRVLTLHAQYSGGMPGCRWLRSLAKSVVLCDPSYNCGGASVGANQPNEDRFRVLRLPHRLVTVLADGHGSHQVAQFVVEKLPPQLVHAFFSDSDVTSAFLAVDDMVRAETFSKDALLPSHAGACTISAIVGQESVLIANAGDSRALLISAKAFVDPPTPIPIPNSSPDWLPAHARWVSELHMADNVSEQAVLRSEHPNESDLIQCRQKIVELAPDGSLISSQWGACYVKGLLQPTRAFGDFYLKTSDFNFFFAHSPSIPLSTPPYVRADPTCVTVPREPGSVLLLASDGLWDYLSATDAVSIISSGMSSSFPAEKIAECLVEAALEVAADSCGLTPQELRAMPTGHARRQIHDDTTAIVVFL